MSLLDEIFPNHTCLVCGGELNQSEHKHACDTCVVTLPRHKRVCDKCGCGVGLHVLVCDRCPYSKWNFTRARAALAYDGLVTGLVLRLKYNSEGDVARFVAPLLAEAVKEHNIKADVIVAVPLAPKRAKERGFNQAGLIARELSKLIEVPVVEDFVVRVRDTKAQKKMTLEERRENLHGAFEIRPPYSVIKGKCVLLVDDVFTTGSTVDECSRVMKKAKPKSIEVLTVASVGKSTSSQ